MRVFCKQCHQRCRTKTEDFGVGPYEYGGQRGVDVNLIEVTDCCSSDEWWDMEEEMIAELQQELAEKLSDSDTITLEQIRAIEKILEGE